MKHQRKYWVKKKQVRAFREGARNCIVGSMNRNEIEEVSKNRRNPLIWQLCKFRDGINSCVKPKREVGCDNLMEKGDQIKNCQPFANNGGRRQNAFSTTRKVEITNSGRGRKMPNIEKARDWNEWSRSQEEMNRPALKGKTTRGAVEGKW